LSRRLSVAALSALLLVLPFEPRRPTWGILGLELTLLEAVAAAALALLACANRERLVRLRARAPVPVLLLWSYVAANGLSAALAPVNRVMAAKFVLRMAGAGVAALVLAATPRDVLRRAAPALALACGAVAVLAILEGSGVRALDPFLDRFRDGPYWLGESRRASAGSENPNLAAALLVYGLLVSVGLATLRPALAASLLPATVLLALGLLFTYSRGGLGALLAGLATLWLSLVRRRLPTRAVALAVPTVLGVGVAFVAAEGPWPLRPFSGTTAPAYAARYEPAEGSLALARRERRGVAVTVTNTGLRPWAAAVLGCSWQRVDAALALDGQATSACPVTRVPGAAPGDSVRVEAAVVAPDAEGRYRLVLDLVADGWVLSSAGVPPAILAVNVGGGAGAAPPPDPGPSAPARGRGDLWRTAVSIWREHPITGIGPDNFRWVHAAYAAWPGRGAQDTLVPANNLFLEAAASTGSLGLLALVATLAATARAAWAALAGAHRPQDAVSGAVLLALTAALVVHGTVDSFLGFTAHYLFLGLVVGAAGALAAAAEE